MHCKLLSRGNITCGYAQAYYTSKLLFYNKQQLEDPRMYSFRFGFTACQVLFFLKLLLARYLVHKETAGYWLELRNGTFSVNVQLLY